MTAPTDTTPTMAEAIGRVAPVFDRIARRIEADRAAGDGGPDDQERAS